MNLVRINEYLGAALANLEYVKLSHNNNPCFLFVPYSGRFGWEENIKDQKAIIMTTYEYFKNRGIRVIISYEFEREEKYSKTELSYDKKGRGYVIHAR